LFPNAIELKKKRPGMDFEESDSDSDDDFGCTECLTDGIVAKDLQSNLTRLAKHCRDEWVALTNGALLKASSKSPGNRYRLLHKDDLNSWNKFLQISVRKAKKGADPSKTARQTLLPCSTPPARPF